MKHRKLISAALALLLMLNLCVPALAAEPKAYSYTSNANSNLQETDTFLWRDDCFQRSSFLGCDHLKLLSAQTAIASASRYGDGEDIYEQNVSDLGQNIKQMLTDMGFADVETNAFYQSETLPNSAAVAMGHRTITADGKDYTLLAVIPRSAGYKQEWAGNFTVGDGMMHEGFKAARDEDLRFVKQYLASHSISGDLKVWVTGHSRGAAVANLLGGFFAGGGMDGLCDTVSLTPEDVYCYTFATPKTVIPGLTRGEALSVAGAFTYQSDDKDDPVVFTDACFGGIRNYPFDYDFITYLPPAEWGYTYYGSVADMTRTVDGRAVGTDAMLDELNAVSSFAYNEWTGGAVTGNYLDYPGDYRAFRSYGVDLKTLSLVQGEVTGEAGMDAFVDAFVDGLPALATTKEIYTAQYQEMMTALAGLYGMTVLQFSEEYLKNVNSLIAPAILSYFAYASERQNVSEAEALTIALDRLVKQLTGKDHEGIYAIGPDTWVNKRPELAAETTVAVVELLDAVTGGYYLSNDTSAKTYAQAVSVDGFLERTMMYLGKDRNDPMTEEVISLLAGVIPVDYLALVTEAFGQFIPADEASTASLEDAIFYTLYACGYGPAAGSPMEENYQDGKSVRDMLYSLVNLVLAISGVDLPQEINNILAAPDDTPLTKLVEAGLQALVTDGNGDPYPTLAAAADAGLHDGLKKMIDGVLEKIEADHLAYSAAFVQQIRDHEAALLKNDNITRLRSAMCTLLFRTSDGAFDPAQTLQNILTFVGNGGRIPPAHYNEVFIAWGKAAVTAGPADITPTVTISGWTCGETPAVPSVTGNPGDGEVTFTYAPKGGDSFSATVPTAPGDYTVKAAVAATHDYNGGTATADFTVSDPASYAPAPASAVTAVTVPVSGEDATVNLKVEIKGNTAAIKEADIEKVLEAEEVGTVTIDVSSLSENIEEVTVPNALLTKIADAVADEENDADGLEVKLPAGSVTFDGTALDAIAAQAEGKDLTLNLENVKVTALTSAQQKAVGDLEVEVVLDAYLTANGRRISDFKGGSATVKVPYTLKNGQVPAGLVVWYVAADGARTQVPATYDGENIVFTVPHFSNYVIAYDAEKARECPKDSACPIAAFTDAAPTAWYHDGVHFCLENGMMNGVGDGLFDPNGAASRAMIVTILYRLEGKPEVTAANPFDDVAEGQWYTDAVLWAAENKIVEGHDGKFNPNGNITREQLATILYRYAKTKGQGFTGAWMFLLDYPDASEISSWADEAMHWMVMQGVINGKDGKLVPGGDATRAEAATMLMRYSTKLAE